MQIYAGLGLSESVFELSKEYIQQGFLLGRVSNEQRGHYYLLHPDGEFRAEASGKVLFTADSSSDLPKVGDWVAFSPYNESEGIIHAVLPRTSVLSRKDPGSDNEQVLVANVNILFIMQGLDNDFNLRRLERYITMAKQARIEPVVLLNKIDLVADPSEYVDAVRSLDDGMKILPLSAQQGKGVIEVQALLQPGTTGVVVGSSGVGKSTFVNCLLDDQVQETNKVREDDSRGRHTTTARSLFVLPGGGLLIDTPGMRELAPWAEQGTLDSAFEDIEELSEQCRYSDCTHMVEKGCAVLAAVEDGTLDEKRFHNYRKLQKELDYLQNTQSYLEKKNKIMKAHRELYKKVYAKRKS